MRRVIVDTKGAKIACNQSRYSTIQSSICKTNFSGTFTLAYRVAVLVEESLRELGGDYAVGLSRESFEIVLESDFLASISPVLEV